MNDGGAVSCVRFANERRGLPGQAALPGAGWASGGLRPLGGRSEDQAKEGPGLVQQRRAA